MTDCRCGFLRTGIEKPDCCLYRGVFSPDGDRIAIASDSDATSVWDARSGQELRHLRGAKSSYPGPMAFSPDGSRLAASDEEKGVRVWDAQSGKEVLTLRGHEEEVGSVGFSSDGRYLVAGVTAQALIWDAKSGQRTAALVGHDIGRASGIRSGAFSPDGRFIVTTGKDHTVRLWEFTPAAPARLLRDEGNPRRFQFSPDGSLIAAIGDDTVLVWRLGHDTPVRLPSGDALHSEFAFSPDGSRLLVLSEDDEDPIYDSHTLERVGSFSLDVDVYGHSLVTSRPPLSFSPDGSRIVGCTGQNVDRKCRIWDAHSGDERMVLKRVLTATFVGKCEAAGTGALAAEAGRSIEAHRVRPGCSPPQVRRAAGQHRARPAASEQRRGGDSLARKRI